MLGKRSIERHHRRSIIIMLTDEFPTSVHGLFGVHVGFLNNTATAWGLAQHGLVQDGAHERPVPAMHVGADASGFC